LIGSGGCIVLYVHKLKNVHYNTYFSSSYCIHIAIYTRIKGCTLSLYRCCWCCHTYRCAQCCRAYAMPSSQINCAKKSTTSPTSPPQPTILPRRVCVFVCVCVSLTLSLSLSVSLSLSLSLSAYTYVCLVRSHVCTL